MTPFENAARAAWMKVQEQVPSQHRLTDWAKVPADAKKNFTDFLRAALEALMEPSTEMEAAGTNETEIFVYLQYPIALNIWQAMLRKVLEP